jgi:hypothetical protein
MKPLMPLLSEKKGTYRKYLFLLNPKQIFQSMSLDLASLDISISACMHNIHDGLEATGWVGPKF